MIEDYYSYLSREKRGSETTDSIIVHYHKLIIENKKKDADSLREKWRNQKEFPFMKRSEAIKNLIKIVSEPEINLSILPDYSYVIQFQFILEKPYISLDEQDFYIIDNPIRKDKIFGLPYVAPTSWKGSLRAAFWQHGHKSDDKQTIRIFGNEKKVEEPANLKAGRLHLFPTFFDKIDLEIINPHDRERRVGKNPILFECVPSGTSGLFTALYVPFDLVGKEHGIVRKEVSEDFRFIAENLTVMFREYGFGAKTSSGFGIAENNLRDGKISFKIKNTVSDFSTLKFSSFSELLEIASKTEIELLNSKEEGQ